MFTNRRLVGILIDEDVVDSLNCKISAFCDSQTEPRTIKNPAFIVTVIPTRPVEGNALASEPILQPMYGQQFSFTTRIIT